MNEQVVSDPIQRAAMVKQEIELANAMAASIAPGSRQQQFRVIYARLYGELRAGDWRIGPKGNVGGWATRNGRAYARKLARKMARDFMQKAGRVEA